jgi:hypothetical protein
MKTLLDNVNELKQDYTAVENKFIQLSQQSQHLSCYHMQLALPEPNIEYEMKFNKSMKSSIKLQEFLFIENNFLYHVSNYLSAIDALLIELSSEFYANCDWSQCSANKMISNILSFEFESIVIAFAKATEGTMREDLISCLNSSSRICQINSMLNKRNVESLYWRINILRNRAAHVSPIKYDTDDRKDSGNSIRLEPMSYEANFYEIKNGILTLPCRTLADLKKSPYIKKIIYDEILIKGRTENIWDIIFENNSPKGHGKNKSKLVGFGNIFESFDLLRGFIDLFSDMYLYFITVNTAFFDNFPSDFEHLDGNLICLINKQKAMTEAHPISLRKAFEDFH